MKALIFENKVVDIVETEFEVHSSLTWMDCPDECEAYSWTLVDGVLTAPAAEPEMTYDMARLSKYTALNQFELISDDAINGTTTHKDAILAIKAAHPKP
jgi:hypothetical protein